MSKMKDLMIDFVELSLCQTTAREQRNAEFTDLMDSLIAGDSVPADGFRAFIKTWTISRKILETSGERRLRWATKLWNAIDSLTCPESCWQLMLRDLPDVFYAPEVNAMKFTY